TPLTVVVVHNGGGRLFEQLPVAAAVEPATLDEAFVTADDRSFQFAACHFGLAWFLVDDAAALAAALAEARAGGRASLIEARVPPARRRRAPGRLLARRAARARAAGAPPAPVPPRHLDRPAPRPGRRRARRPRRHRRALGRVDRARPRRLRRRLGGAAAVRDAA